MAFSDFMTTPMVLKRRGEKDKWSHFSYTSTDIMGRLQKSDEWNVSPNMIQMVRRGRIYVGPEVDIRPGDKLEVDEEEYLVDDVGFIRNKEGVLHHKEVDV